MDDTPFAVRDAFLPEVGGKQGSQGTTDTSSNMQIDMWEIPTHAAALDRSWQLANVIEDIRHRLRDLRLEEASTSMQSHSKSVISKPILYTSTTQTALLPYTSQL